MTHSKHAISKKFMCNKKKNNYFPKYSWKATIYLPSVKSSFSSLIPFILEASMCLSSLFTSVLTLKTKCVTRADSLYVYLHGTHMHKDVDCPTLENTVFQAILLKIN